MILLWFQSIRTMVYGAVFIEQYWMSLRPDLPGSKLIVPPHQYQRYLPSQNMSKDMLYELA